MIQIDQIFCIRLMQAFGHFMWQGVVLWVVAEVGLKVLKHRSGNVRYLWALTILVLMALAVPLTYWMLRASDHTLDAFANQLVQPTLTPDTDLSASGPSPFSKGGTGSATAETHAANQQFWLQGSAPLTVIYALGVGWMLVRLVGALRGGQQLGAFSQPIEDSMVLAAIGRAVKGMNFAYNPAVAFCRAVAVPSVVGVLQPTLLFPLAVVTGLTSEQLEYVARHELAHIRRHDHVVNLLQRFIESFLFFHPAVWKVSRHVHEEREFCCDELVVKSGCASVAYAESLTTIAKIALIRRQVEPLMLGAAGRRPSHFQRRIRWLIDVPEHQPIRMTRGSTTMLGMFSAGMMLCLLALCVRVVPASTIPPAAERLPDLSSSHREPLRPDSGVLSLQWTLLHRAVFGGTNEEIQLLLSHRADPNVRTTQGWTPLHFAACLNRVLAIRMLIEAGAGVDARNKDGDTPLLSALGFNPPISMSAFPATSAVLELLDQGASVNLANNDGITPLHAAVIRGNVALAQELMSRGARVDAPDAVGRTPLHFACDRADADMIRLLVAHNANCTLTDQQGRSTLQHLALRVGQASAASREAVRRAAPILRAGGAVPDFCTAIVIDDEQLVRSILKQDPKVANEIPSVTTQNWRPIFWAVNSDNLAVCKLLVEAPYSVDPNSRAADGATPLHRAVVHDDGPQILQVLLKAGADPCAADKAGYSPLHVAAMKRKTDFLRALLAAKADPNVVETAYHRTPLHFAVMVQQKGQIAPVAANVTALIAAKANVNAADVTGRTALHYACAVGRIDLVEALLAAPDIDVNAVDHGGATPLSLATSSSNADSQLIQLLSNRGAKVSKGWESTEHAAAGARK